jgi:hypothetical protein
MGTTLRTGLHRNLDSVPDRGKRSLDSRKVQAGSGTHTISYTIGTGGGGGGKAAGV